MKSMKKVCALLVCASMAFSVFACSSEAEGKPDRSSDDAEETEVQETNVDTSETTSVVVESEETDVQEPETSRPGGIYSVAGMDADEIMDLIAYLSDVSAGDTADSYCSKFPVEPMFIVSPCLAYFERENGDDDIILSAGVVSTINEDGTFALADGDYVDIVFDFSDEELSIEVYDRVFNMLCEELPDAEVTDDRDGNIWNSSVGSYEMLRQGMGSNSIQIDIPISAN